MKNVKLLLVALLAIVFTPRVLADDNVEVGGVVYSGASEYSTSVTAQYVSSSFSGNRLDIPSTITVNGRTYTVTQISEDFWRVSVSSQIYEIHIPPTVSNLRTGALGYDGFENLATLVFEEGDNGSALTKLPDVFANKPKLTKVVLPASLEEIADYAFHGCEYLTDLTIKANSDPNKVIYIGDQAFAGCIRLQTLSLPRCYLRDKVFAGCELLKTVTISDMQGVGEFVFGDCKRLETLTIGIMPISDDYVGFCYNCKALKTVNFPSYYYSQVTSIPRAMFSGCEKLTQAFSFPNVKDIGLGAFAGIHGLNLTLSGDQVIGLSSSTFYESTGTLKVKYPLKEAYEQTMALQNSSLTVSEYDVPAPVEPLAAYQEVGMFPDNTSFTQWYAQYNYEQLKSVKRLKIGSILKGTDDLDDWEGIREMCGGYLDNGEPSGLSLTSLDLYNSGFVTGSCFIVGKGTVNFNSQHIPEYAFYQAAGIDTLILPITPNSIDAHAFEATNPNLVIRVYWHDQLFSSDNDAFNNTDGTSSVANMTLIVPEGQAEMYMSHPLWSKFGTIIEDWQAYGTKARLTVTSGVSNKPVELWVDGEKVATISKKGGTTSQMVTSDASVELRVPDQYFSKILVNGIDRTTTFSYSSPTEAEYAGYKFYHLGQYSGVNSIEAVFEDVPPVFETYGLMFNIDGGSGEANVAVTYADGSETTFSLEHEYGESTNKALNYYATTNTGETYATTKEIEQIVVTAEPATDDFAHTIVNSGYRNLSQVQNNEGKIDAVDNGEGVYTYTMLGKNMTSSFINLTFPEDLDANVKTSIRVDGNYDVKYFFFDFDIGDGFTAVNMSTDYVSGTTTVLHNGSSDSYGYVYIYVPQDNPGCRVILNGEVIPFNNDRRLKWNGDETTDYDIYMGDKYGDAYTKVACYQLSLSDCNAISEDSWIVIDDGSTNLNEIVSPWKVPQAVKNFGDGTIKLLDKNNTVVETIAGGESKTVNWTKDDDMKIKVEVPEGSNMASYEAHLIIDGTDNVLAKVTNAQGKQEFEEFPMDDITTAHSILLILNGSAGTGLRGDVNNDGKVTVTDAVNVVDIILGN